MNAHVQVKDFALRDSKGRFRKSPGLPAAPETVPYERYSACWQRLDALSQIAFKMKMQWGLLGPLIADQLGRAEGPLNGLLEGGGVGLYVLSTEDADLMDYHLIQLGNLIDDLEAADVA